MKHQKHAKLTKPDHGFFARNEISFLGSNCNLIKKLTANIRCSLSNTFNIGYVDADHASHNDKGQIEKAIFKREMTDKISYHRFDTYPESTLAQRNAFFNDCDLVIVNGNHERANNQIVIIDCKKEASLKKRSASLTHVIGLIGIESLEIPDYIKAIIPHYDKLPLFLIKDESAISHFVGEFLKAKTPAINGLILGGGKSTRMGEDKLNIDYHGASQLDYLKQILSPVCKDIFVSLVKDQDIDNTILDTFLELGPYGGIVSAFQKNPNCAWFAVACDIPLLDEKTISMLVKKRDPSKVATCFYNSETKFPEPLITIWEPRAYPILLQYLSLGYSCPRKVLINTDVKVVKLEDETVLLNANTLEDRNRANNLLSKTIS